MKNRIKEIFIIIISIFIGIMPLEVNANSIVINKSLTNLKDSKEYEVLSTSKIYKVKNSNKTDTYAIDIKNTSKKRIR